MATNVVSQIEIAAPVEIDREKICPFLLRIFCSSGRHSFESDYDRGSIPTSAKELQIYTWKDCTLRELTTLIKDVNPEARKRGIEFKFAVVTPHPRNSRFVLKDVGIVANGERGGDGNKTLANISFSIGDYIDVAIVSPNHRNNSPPGYRNGSDRRYSTSYQGDRQIRRYGGQFRNNFRD